MQETARTGPSRVPFRDAFYFWLKLGFINFGGPAGQIAIMHTELVDRRRWVDDPSFLHALNYCMLLPGPEAQQLAIYVGWLMHRLIGGLVAGIFFVLPGFFFMLALSWLYATRGDVTWVDATFFGLSAAVIAIVVSAVIRIGSRALKNNAAIAIAASAFVAIGIVGIGFPFIVLGAAALGFAAARSGLLEPVTPHGPAPEAVPEGAPTHAPVDPTAARAVRVILIGLAAWWGPLLLVGALRGASDVFAQEAVFFSKAALVTFGGAYAVLSYINQAAVEQFGWLEPGQMVTGLGLAESTPGPLIMVTQFVGFLAAYQNPGGLDPLVAGVLGAAVAVWATFAPCFLWIFLGAPYIERMRGNVRLTSALSAVTAAVVGVIGSLALWFAVHVLFTDVRDVDFLLGRLPIPDATSLDLLALAIAAGAFGLLQLRKWSVVAVVGISAAAGLVLHGLL